MVIFTLGATSSLWTGASVGVAREAGVLVVAVGKSVAEIAGEGVEGGVMIAEIFVLPFRVGC